MTLLLEGISKSPSKHREPIGMAPMQTTQMIVAPLNGNGAKSGARTLAASRSLNTTRRASLSLSHTPFFLSFFLILAAPACGKQPVLSSFFFNFNFVFALYDVYT